MKCVSARQLTYGYGISGKGEYEMSRIITIGSNKGGVGKTTTSLNLSYSFSRLGYKVLLLDGDLQGGIESSTNLRKVSSSGLIAALKGEKNVADLVKFTRNNQLAIMGMGASEADDAVILEESVRSGQLKKIVYDLSVDFDYVFIDVPAGFSSSVQAFLGVSDGLLLVLNCHALTLKTLPPFLRVVQSCQERNNNLQFDGVLITMVNRKSARSMNVLKEFRQAIPSDILLKTIIPFNDHFEIASMKSIPVGLLHDGESAARSYFNLAMELKERELEFASKEKRDEDEGLF